MSFDVNKPSSILAAYYIGLVGVSSFILQPGIVGGLVEYLGFNDIQAGNTVAIEMLGVAVTAMLMSIFPSKVNWRKVTLLFLGLVILGNLLSVFMSDFTSFISARFLAGLGYGGLISIGFAAICMTVNPDRNFGIYLIIVLTYGALGLFVLPSLFQAFGTDSAWIAMMILAAIGTLFIRNIPSSGADRMDTPPDALNVPSLLRWSAIAGIFMYNIGIGILWTYVFLIGLEAGLGEQQTANVLTISQVFGIMGAIATTFIATRYGRIGPLVIGILGGAAVILLLVGKPSLAAFSAAICGFNFFWNYVLPYIMSSLASYSTSGNIVTKGVSSQMIATAIAPALGAYILSQDLSYNYIVITSSLAFFIALLLLVPPAILHKNLLKRLAS